MDSADANRIMFFTYLKLFQSGYIYIDILQFMNFYPLNDSQSL
jgi:hypothetical protein